MTNIWLLHISYDSPQLSDSDPERITFENDKRKHDEFFITHPYNILIISSEDESSYQVPGKKIYILGKDFFQHLDIFENHSNNSPDAGISPSYMLEIYDRVVMGLSCLKDVAQQIDNTFYVKPYALRVKTLLEQMGFNVITDNFISEGGIFLKGTPPSGTPFLIISHNFIEHFQKLKLPLLRCPPDIGNDPNDTHIDTYLGIINFREARIIDGTVYNGILYVHTGILKKIHADAKKQDVWQILKAEMENRGYLMREYSPETEYQNIGINFKFDCYNDTLLSNAFPKKERFFLNGIGINVIAPELNFGSNNFITGGVNCSYLLIPYNKKIQENIINWITTK